MKTDPYVTFYPWYVLHTDIKIVRNSWVTMFQFMSTSWQSEQKPFISLGFLCNLTFVSGDGASLLRQGTWCPLQCQPVHVLGLSHRHQSSMAFSAKKANLTKVFQGCWILFRLVVSNIFYFHPYLGKCPIWLIFFKRVETTNQFWFELLLHVQKAEWDAWDDETIQSMIGGGFFLNGGSLLAIFFRMSIHQEGWQSNVEWVSLGSMVFDTALIDVRRFGWSHG